MAESLHLKSLLEGLSVSWAGASGDPEIAGVSHDSRRVKPGDLFVALKGQKTDAHDLAAGAVKSGARAVLAERALPLDVPVAVVPSTLAALSRVAARFHGEPSKGMTVVGVTGTNGKTTTTYMLEAVLRAAGLSAGVLGTISYRWAGKTADASNTTPLSLELQRLFRDMRADGVTHAAMEVSSHALSLHRVDDVAFAGGVFTNLTRDHMDFHKTMEAYFDAKAKLFEALPPGEKGGFAIINRDDAWAEKLFRRTRARVATYGLRGPADLTAADLALGADGTSFTLVFPKGRTTIQLQSVGTHNVYNALGAAGAALALGISPEALQRGLSSLAGVPGRLEPVKRASGSPFNVFVDYAHTDDALRNVLGTLRPLTKGRLITVFGCGGDRDRTKRPLMGQAAAALSDHVVVTSDNSRSEDPARIAKDIEEGLLKAGASNYEVVLDRASAIEKAVRSARAGDVVLIAGKGHETYQIFKDRTIHFDDREVAREALERLT